MSKRRVASGLAGALMITVLAACGSDEGSGAPAGNVGSGVRLSAPINIANCEDWEEGTVEERLGSIAQIEQYTGGNVAGTGREGGVLSDERAYDLFEATCANEYARGFKLYKVYGRGAAFGGE